MLSDGRKAPGPDCQNRPAHRHRQSAAGGPRQQQGRCPGHIQDQLHCQSSPTGSAVTFIILRSQLTKQDPRLTVAWARKNDVPIEKLFSKTLREKFPWAEAEADADWIF
jgi:hypothetical protein